MNRTAFYISLIIIVIALAFAAINIYWLIFPIKVVEFQDNPLPVITKEVGRGELLQYRVRVCKYVAEEAETVTSFVDGLIFVSDKFTTNKTSGCTDTIQSVVVPDVLPYGEYRYRISLTYQLNPIRRENYSIETEPFLIVIR